jgi:hypothetical protein
MDIHKPKAAHSWREFLVEIGTIICGILIALGLEQAVEAFHWRHEVEQQREALRREARANLGAVAYRVSETACLEGRLNEMEALFGDQVRHVQQHGKLRAPHPPFDVESTGSWDIAVSGQALAHMPLSEKLAFSNAFDAYKAFNQLRNAEDAIWRRFEPISHISMLNETDWSALHQTFGEAWAIDKRMKSLSSYILTSATLDQRSSEISQSDADQHDMKAFCSPIMAAGEPGSA